jgi:transmembrane sensor
MSNIVNIPERKDPEPPDIAAEARAWVITLDGEQPPDAKLQQFREWLQLSPQHREAFKSAAAVWGDLDHWSEFLYPEVVGRDSSRQTGGLVRPDSSRHQYGLRLALSTAGLAAVAVAASLYLFGPTFLGQSGEFTADYGSAIGEVKAVALPDGSDVRLNTRSRIAVSYARAARVVHLTEGEAFFEVAHDPKKPFVVYAGKYAVKAVGTAFSVQLLPGGVELNVTEGRVEVSALREHAPERKALDVDIEKAISAVPFVKGQHVILKEDKVELELVQTVPEEEMEVQLAWRNGLLIFDDDPLEQVVTEISRYTPIRIVIADAEIRDLRFGGYFRVDDVPAILSTMEKGFGLHVEQVDDKLIYLSRQPTAPRQE